MTTSSEKKMEQRKIKLIEAFADAARILDGGRGIYLNHCIKKLQNYVAASLNIEFESLVKEVTSVLQDGSTHLVHSAVIEYLSSDSQDGENSFFIMMKTYPEVIDTLAEYINKYELDEELVPTVVTHLDLASRRYKPKKDISPSVCSILLGMNKIVVRVSNAQELIDRLIAMLSDVDIYVDMDSIGRSLQ